VSGRATFVGNASERKDAVTQFRDTEGSRAGGPFYDEAAPPGGAAAVGPSRRDVPVHGDSVEGTAGDTAAAGHDTVDGSLGGNGVGASLGAGHGSGLGGGDDGGSGDDGSGGGSSSGAAGGHKPGGTMLGLLRETVTVVAIALGLSLLIKTFLVQAFYIPSESMENTLLIGDRVLVSKLTPGPFDLDRGDVVVFSDPGDWLTLPPKPDEGPLREGFRNALTFVGLLPADSGDHLIKRVIGLPGDKVACCDDKGRLTVNGKPVDEPYLFPGDEPSSDDFTVTVPAGRLWVMGDHRGVSQDSRYHRELADGTVAISDVVGRAFVVVWPFDRAKLLRTPDSFDQVPAP
jgi:signal peptidase I